MVLLVNIWKFSFVPNSILQLNAFPESNFYREESCAKVRGFCLLEAECPHEVDKEYRSLCPSQKNGGAICCKDCEYRIKYNWMRITVYRITLFCYYIYLARFRDSSGFIKSFRHFWLAFSEWTFFYEKFICKHKIII